MREHALDSFSDCSVHSLCHSIVLRGFRHTFIKPDAMCSAIIFKQTPVFTTIIRPDALMLPSLKNFQRKKEKSRILKSMNGASGTPFDRGAIRATNRLTTKALRSL
ncbi:unnamed protein product (mitochondrion) [Musa textilis]